MAKLPSWLVAESCEVRDGELVQRLRVRAWHPGFWLAALREHFGR